jgi:hypothetical protein
VRFTARRDCARPGLGNSASGRLEDVQEQQDTLLAVGCDKTCFDTREASFGEHDLIAGFQIRFAERVGGRR